MRWKALLPLLFIVISITVGYILFFDRIITSLLIQSGETITEAKIDIESSKLTWSPFGIQLNNLQVADKDHPMKNSFEANVVNLSLEINPLFSGNYIVDTVKINGLKYDTDRSTSGELARYQQDSPIDESKNNATNESIDQTDNQETSKKEALTEKLNDIDVSDYVDTSQLSSTKQADKIKADIETLKIKFSTLTDSNSLNSKLDDLKKRTNDFKNIGSIKSELDALKNEIVTEKNAFSTDIKGIQANIKGLKQAGENDVKTTLNTVNIKSLSSGNLSETLLSDSLQNTIEKGRYILDLLKRYRNLNSPTEKKEVYQGIDVTFPSTKHPLPKFWIKKIHLSGTHDGQLLDGRIENISSNPDIINKPISYTFGINSIFTSDGTIDLRNNTLTISLTFEKTEPISSPKTIVNDDRYTISLREGNMITNGVFNSTDSTIDGTLTGLGTQLLFESTNKTLSDSLSHVNDISITTQVAGTFSKPTFKITSDIDKKIGHALQQVYNEELNKKKKEIQATFDASVTNAQNELSSQLSSLSSSIDSDFSKQLLEVNSLEEVISLGKEQAKSVLDKETEKLKLKKDELTKDLEKKAKALFNDLF